MQTNAQEMATMLEKQMFLLKPEEDSKLIATMQTEIQQLRLLAAVERVH